MLEVHDGQVLIEEGQILFSCLGYNSGISTYVVCVGGVGDDGSSGS